MSRYEITLSSGDKINGAWTSQYLPMPSLTDTDITFTGEHGDRVLVYMAHVAAVQIVPMETPEEEF